MSNKIDDELKYTYNHIKRFASLELLNNINKFKSVLLPLTVCIIFIVALIQGFSKYNITSLKSIFEYSMIKNPLLIFLFIFIGLVSTHLISFCLHKIAYKSIIKFRPYKTAVDENEDSKPKKQNIIVLLLLRLLSPDLYYANLYKKRLSDSIDKRKSFSYANKFVDSEDKKTTLQWSLIRIERKSFIEYSNWLNIISTCFILIFCLFLEFPLFCSYFKQGVLTCLIVRLLSRALEIAIAFYTDVVQVNSKMFETENNKSEPIYYNGFNSSLIRQNGRLSLAIHSLVEMIFLFAAIYYVLFMILSESHPTLLDTLMISTSLGVFNISFDYYQNILLAFLHTSQILISCILILLSIAQYLGADRSLSSNEQILYREFSIFKHTHESNKNKFTLKEFLINTFTSDYKKNNFEKNFNKYLDNRSLKSPIEK